MASSAKSGGKDSRSLPTVLNDSQSEPSLSGAGIGAAAKAALSDFVFGRTNAAATREVSRLLAVACRARQLELSEANAQGPCIFY